MDQIRLTGIRAAGKHGVLDFEHERAQTFVVDATLFLDLAPAGTSDDLNDTVDYGAIAKGIVAIIEGEHVDLIEKLAARIADMILEYPAVANTQVTVHKPNAPIVVPFDDVSVTVERSRKTLAGTADDGRVHRAVIAIGGNQGDVPSTLRDAVRCIDGLESTQVTGISPLYRTDAWGMPEGTPEFHNAVVIVKTKLDATRLLDGLHRIEANHGRVRNDHWASRTLDLDIIDFDGVESDDPDLTLPHPRAWQRAFVLAPWLAVDPDAELGGEHAGSVAQLLFEASDRAHVNEISVDWMTGDSSDDPFEDSSGDREPGERETDNREIDDYGTCDSRTTTEGTVASKAAAAARTQENPVSRRAVISLDSPSTDAERQFRKAIVAIDGIPGNQVEGISPLYHVGLLDGTPDKMSAVVQISTRLDAAGLIETLISVQENISDDLDIDLVDMEGVVCDEPNCRVPWPSAREHASVLAPWLDMDPDAKLGKDPVSFLLAMAPDSAQVGMLADNWIIGGTL